MDPRLKWFGIGAVSAVILFLILGRLEKRMDDLEISIAGTDRNVAHIIQSLGSKQ